MKARLSMTGLVLLLLVLWLEAASSNAKLNFEKALLLEEANGKLQQAIALYQKVTAEAGSDEALAAEAQLHIGMCHEKLAKDQARKAYQTVIDKYPSQAEPVRIARQRLASLNSGLQARQAVTVREFSGFGGFKSGLISDPASSPHTFVTSKDGQTFVYPDYMTGDLIVKNLVTSKMQSLYNVSWEKSDESFDAPILSPDENRVAYVNYSYAHNSSSKVRLGVDSLRGGKREILYESQTNLYPHDWSPDGTKILVAVASSDRSVYLATVDARDKKLQRLVSLSRDYPYHAEYSPDGRFIAYDSAKDTDRKIYMLSNDGLQEHVLVDSPGEDDSPVWSPDGRFVVFRSNRLGDWGLFSLPIQDGKASGEPLLIKANIGEATFLRNITTEGRLFYGEAVSAGKITIARRNDNQELTGSWSLPNIKSPGSRDPNFAPDGNSMVYVTDPSLGRIANKLRIVTLDGMILREVSLRPEFQGLQRPAFSPDGRKIVLQASGKIVVVSAETGAVLKAFEFDPENSVAQSGWSKDSRQLYARIISRDGSLHLETIEVETEKRTSSPLPGRSLYWPGGVSPDGRFLAVGISDARKRRIVLRSLSNGIDKTLDADDLDGSAVWDFDSKHIFYRKDETHLCRLSIEDGTKQVLFVDLKSPVLHAVSPDGRFLAFRESVSDRRIWVLENFLPKAKELAAR